MTSCPHCPDGHDSPLRKPWGVYIAPARDGDGQPTTLHVAPSNGAHVAESDAEWLRALIDGDQTSASQIVDEILAPLKARVGVAEHEWQAATRRAERAEAEVTRLDSELAALRAEVTGLRAAPVLCGCLVPGCLAQYDAAARVRELHSEIPDRPGSCYCANAYPCPTIRALAGAVSEEQTGGGA